MHYNGTDGNETIRTRVLAFLSFFSSAGPAMYLNISGAGLFALFIALFISPVVSIPIQQASQSGLSFSSHSFAKQQDLVYHVSAGKIQPQTSLQNVPVVSTTTKALTDNVRLLSF